MVSHLPLLPSNPTFPISYDLRRRCFYLSPFPIYLQPSFYRFFLAASEFAFRSSLFSSIPSCDASYIGDVIAHIEKKKKVWEIV